MTYFGIIAGLALTWAIGCPRPFGRYIAQVVSAYRAALQEGKE